MVAKAHDLNTRKRLHHPREYRNFFNKSQVYKLTECTIFRVQNDLGHFRLGITLKAKGTSVQRNQVKRQIRESFRTQQSQLGGFDYNVVIPGYKSLEYPYPVKLGQCLRERLTRAISNR